MSTKQKTARAVVNVKTIPEGLNVAMGATFNEYIFVFFLIKSFVRNKLRLDGFSRDLD